MDLKPVSYDSLRTVLQHMEANTRIQMSARIPSIRKTEKAVPLKIDHLSFEYDSIRIGNIDYRVGVIRDYGDLKTPEYVKDYNDNGGISCDLDEYGFEDQNSMSRRTHPEDILIKSRVYEQPPPHNDDTRRQKEDELLNLKNQIAEHDNEYKQYLTDHGFENIEDLGEQLHSAREESNEERYETLRRVLECMSLTNSRIISMLYAIDEIRYYFQCHDNFRNKTSAPYTPYVKLTVIQWTNDDDECKIKMSEKVKYNKQISLALRDVSNFIFGGRRHPVHVKTLSIDQLKIIRVPSNLQLKVQRIEVDGHLEIIFKAISPIIHSSSFPLKELRVQYCSDRTDDGHIFNNTDFEIEVARSAHRLTIGYCRNNITMLPIFSALQNKIVERSDSYNALSVADYAELIRTWAVQGKSTGTIFTFQVHRRETAQKVIDRVAKELQGAVKGDRCVNVPIANCSSLFQVSYRVNEEREEDYDDECTLEMKVVPSNDTAIELIGDLRVE